jgi:hypothetical protein
MPFGKLFQGLVAQGILHNSRGEVICRAERTKTRKAHQEQSALISGSSERRLIGSVEKLASHKMQSSMQASMESMQWHFKALR